MCLGGHIEQLPSSPTSDLQEAFFLQCFMPLTLEGFLRQQTQEALSSPQAHQPEWPGGAHARSAPCLVPF